MPEKTSGTNEQNAPDVKNERDEFLSRFLTMLEQPRIGGAQLATQLLEHMRPTLISAAAITLSRGPAIASEPHDFLGDIWEEFAESLTWQRRKNYSHRSADEFQGWVWQVARRTVLRVIKREQRSRILGAPFETVFRVASGEGLGNYRVDPEHIDLVRTRIERRLRGRHRLVMLVYFELRDERRTAERCNIKIETVRRYIRESGPIISRD